MNSPSRAIFLSLSYTCSLSLSLSLTLALCRVQGAGVDFEKCPDMSSLYRHVQMYTDMFLQVHTRAEHAIGRGGSGEEAERDLMI